MIARKSVELVTVAAVVAALLSAPATPAFAGNYESDAGYGILATVTNLFYMPAKLIYAGAGGLVGGLAYLATAGDIDTARGVWSPTVGGDYVVTGAMLRGDQPIFFVGPTYRSGEPANQDAPLNWGREPMR